MKGFRIKVKGIVQGVGFRPFVKRLAQILFLRGFVSNTRSHVLIEIEGEEGSCSEFLKRLGDEAPKAARIAEITIEERDLAGYKEFSIVESHDQGETMNITPDLAICPDCRRELEDPEDRRFGYALNNCTQCGPRFTIIKNLPYDRENTTMADFEMCSKCREEYEDMAGRRYHAQPVSCWDCGPVIRGTDPLSLIRGTDLLKAARDLLKADGILAVKGMGGYHLACNARSDLAVDLLRKRKARDGKPFAVMVKDVETAAKLCHISRAEKEILESEAAPIVLLTKKESYDLSRGVSQDNPRLGLMLAYTPLHLMLFRDGIDVLVMTSGNISDEPICYKDEEAFEKLRGIADAFLTHNREIYYRNDDSVVACVDGREYFIRRSRGYVPVGVKLTRGTDLLLSYGAELKSTFCIVKDQVAYPSHHIGDLEHFDAVQEFENGIKHFEKIFRFKPDVLVADLHPGYISTKLAEQRAYDEELRIVIVQHHYAHMLSCMADNELDEEILGLILDGTGYGDDGSIWGCELLQGDRSSYKRIGTLMPVPLPGADAAVKQPWRMALSWMQSAGVKINKEYLNEWPEADGVMRLLQQGEVKTSSAGRLFDAVSSILGLCHFNSYEAEAAMKLEWAGNRGTDLLFNLEPVIRGTDLLFFNPSNLIKELLDGLKSGKSVDSLAFSFHYNFAKGLVKLCQGSELRTVVLSGGVFQNLLLLDLTRRFLEEEGFKVFIHRKVPCNDAGVSLGQCYYSGV